MRSSPERSSQSQIQPSKGLILDSLVQYLSSEPEKNIQAIVRLAAETLKATCAVYNKVDGKTGMLVTCAEYGLPPDYNTKTPPEGRLCYETVINGNKKAVVIEDLQSTPFAKSDPNIMKYGYRSYLVPIHKLGKLTGLRNCVLDDDAQPCEEKAFPAPLRMILNLFCLNWTY